MLIVKGVKHSYGTYNGYEYDNFVLECENTEPPKEMHFQDRNVLQLCGSRSEEVKVRVSDFKAVFNGYLDSPEDFELLLGCSINPLYGKGSRVMRIEVLDDAKQVTALQYGKGVY